jgi:DNA repair protein RecO (recombination protein O)
MPILSDDVAILKSRDFSEYDKILTFFGREKGKFNAIAKGIRRLTSRKKGHLGTFNLCKISYATGKNLDIVLEAEAYFIIDTEKMMTEEYARIGFAGLLLDRLLPESISEPKIFDLWKNYIGGCHDFNSTNLFAIEVLNYLGFVPEHKLAKWREASRENRTYNEIHLEVRRIMDMT